MKSKTVLYASMAALLAAVIFSLNPIQLARAGTGKILYYTCPMHPTVKSDKAGACPICNMDLQPVYESDVAGSAPAATNNATSGNNKPIPYPLTTCVVSGEKLGEMGDPIVFIYTNNGANQEIKFCCSMCKPKFLADPDKYMKIIKAAEDKK